MAKEKEIFKTSHLKLKEVNTSKTEVLHSFIKDYQNATIFYIDYLWNNKIYYKIKDIEKSFDIKNNKLDIPSMLSTVDITINSNLSARALKCSMTQALAIINAHLDKNKRYEYIRNKLKSEGKRTRSISLRIKNKPIIYPDVSNIYPELNSICCEYIDNPDTISHFDGLIILSSIGKSYGKIIIPINHNKHSRKLAKTGKLCSSFQISNDKISFKYKFEKAELKTKGRVVGADQGINTCLTLSDEQTTPKCNHGHDLHSITTKLANKKSGSKAFSRAKEHQKNYVHWSINQLDFTNIKQINIESISNFRKGKNVGRFLNSFCESLIMEVTKTRCSLEGVLLKKQSSAYRSQRCSSCGYVYSGNRKGKNFRCKHCNFTTDADLNASLNHEINLSSANFLRYLSNRPRKFFWKIEGIYDLEGQEFTVPDKEKDIKYHKRYIKP